MSEFERETDMVLSMPYRNHGKGGELPCVAVKVLPADRAERVCEIDRRIEEVKRVLPVAVRLVICLAIIMAVAIGWVHPAVGGCMEFVYLLQLFFAWRNMGHGDADFTE